MTADALLDSNVLLYAVSRAPDEQEHRRIARKLLSGERIGFSSQVFSEFYDNATRKLEPRLSHSQAVAILEPLRGFPVQPVTLDVVWKAFSLKDRYQLRFWDACILAAAHLLGCSRVYIGHRLAG